MHVGDEMSCGRPSRVYWVVDVEGNGSYCSSSKTVWEVSIVGWYCGFGRADWMGCVWVTVGHTTVSLSERTGSDGMMGPNWAGNGGRRSHSVGTGQ